MLRVLASISKSIKVPLFIWENIVNIFEQFSKIFVYLLLTLLPIRLGLFGEEIYYIPPNGQNPYS